MKYVKMLGLAAFAAALMAFVVAGSASATTLDCNGSACALNAAVHSELENGATNPATLHPPIGDIKCEESTVAGEVSELGSSTTTAGGPVNTLSFGKCNATVNVIHSGSLSIHTNTANSDNNGLLTSTGAEVTVVFLGFHCIFGTSATPIGTLTGSGTTGATATLDISAKIPRTGGTSGAFCGKEAEWTGSYKVGTPDSLNVT